MWQDIASTVASEFSDLSVAEFTRVTLRVAIAAVLGGLLGYERERQGKAAGVRTHMIVAIGAALFMTVSQQIGLTQSEIGRVLQGIITGIGFLGAGTIVKSEQNDVLGLTTAAGIWLTAAIGVAVGLGMAMTAILTTLFALLILALIPRFQQRKNQVTATTRDVR